MLGELILHEDSIARDPNTQLLLTSHWRYSCALTSESFESIPLVTHEIDLLLN